MFSKPHWMGVLFPFLTAQVSHSVCRQNAHRSSRFYPRNCALRACAQTELGTKTEKGVSEDCDINESLWQWAQSWSLNERCQGNKWLLKAAVTGACPASGCGGARQRCAVRVLGHGLSHISLGRCTFLLISLVVRISAVSICEVQPFSRDFKNNELAVLLN